MRERSVKGLGKRRERVGVFIWRRGRARGGFGGGWRRGGRGVVARRRRRRAARPSGRTAGRLKKRLTVGPGVAVREKARARRSVRTERTRWRCGSDRPI